MKGLSKKLIRTITVGDNKVKIKPTQIGLEKILVSGELKGVDKVKTIISGMEDMLMEANPDVSKPDISAFVLTNYAMLLPEVMKLFGYNPEKMKIKGTMTVEHKRNGKVLPDSQYDIAI